MPLTDQKIRGAQPKPKPYKLTDGAGLYLHVFPKGAKLWRLRYRLHGKENVFAIGSYKSITLAEARTARDEAKKLIKKGTPPAAARKSEKLLQRAASANTFEAVAREWLKGNRQRWSAAHHAKVTRTMEAGLFPDLGDMPIKSVTAAHILAVIQGVEKRGAPVVALLLRQWTSAVFRFAVATLRADADPAAALKGAIHAPKVRHYKALDRGDIAPLIKALGTSNAQRPTVIALRLLMLTFVRTIELRGATWAEFDLERAEWRIPASRMKMGEAHLVPLSEQAVALLRELSTITGGRAHLFPNQRNPRTYLAGGTLNKALVDIGYRGKLSAHGFRATASTILNELGFPPNVIEKQLAHKERNKVVASYNRAEYVEDRRKMMQQWADLLDQLATGNGKVVPGKFGKAAA